MALVFLDQVFCGFNGIRAVDGVSLTLPEGGFLALLGPSGCGKTTLLRLIAGLERPESGTIRIGGTLAAGEGVFVPPEARGLGMVFQSYALWPHMTVAGNIRFGLKIRRLSRAEQAERLEAALEATGLTGLEDRRPHELSGGQKQRVALARCLAMRPPLILLDEPLANLDAHLRASMLAEFRRIHALSGAGFVFVTHDQDEAMAVAGLVGVMNAGRLEQIASPQELHRAPATPMVARFVGGGRTLPAEALGVEGGALRLRLQGRVFSAPGAAAAGPVWLCVRARDLSLAGEAEEGLRASALESRFRDGAWLVSARLEGLGDQGEVEYLAPRPPAPGEPVTLRLAGGWTLPRAA